MNICKNLHVNQDLEMMVQRVSIGKFLIRWERSDMIKTDVKLLNNLDKNPCQVVDCAFHPDSFKFGYSYGSFQAMMISIAL